MVSSSNVILIAEADLHASITPSPLLGYPNSSTGLGFSVNGITSETTPVSQINDACPFHG